MPRYKVLIIGLGSIGKRYINILNKICACEIYALREHNKDREDTASICSYIFDRQELLGLGIDFAIICNPSALHMETALFLAKNGIPFVIEKPVCVSINRNVRKLLNIVKNKKLQVLVGFNLRYHYLYKKIKHIISSGKLGKILSFFSETGQYLPTWRNFDYQRSYSSHKELGGGVIFDLTHEIDLAADLLGEVRYLTCLKSKVSSLKINTEDIAEVTFLHKNKMISHLHLDYLQKEYTRRFKLVCEKGEILWDYALGKLRIISENKKYEFFQPKDYTRDETFKSQLKHWFKVLENKQKPLVSLEKGIYVSRLAIYSHVASEKRKWLKVN